MLAEAVRELAGCDRRSPAVLVCMPDGEYLVSRDGSGGHVRNAYVISRAQLGEVMTAAGLRRADLGDPGAAMRLADLVAAFARRRCGRVS